MNKTTKESLKKFTAARFGLFLHWGLYSLPGGRWHGRKMDYIGEWLQSAFRIPCADYSQLARRFHPVNFDAETWVNAAQNAGMKYIVYTAKHHDGFAMYRSRVDDFCITEATPFRRDPLAELAEACRNHRMALGIYYSHCLDWHEQNAADPGPEAPKNFGMSWGNDWDFPDWRNKKFSVYLERKVKPQLAELLTQYGDILLIWFDCADTITKEQAQDLRGFVKKLQPGCLVNSRIGHNLGDFGSLGDNQHPANQSEKIMLESPNTLNHTWGFKWDDHAWQDSASVVSTLVKLNSRDVNFLLNIGPRPDGRLPEPTMDLLTELGHWRQKEKYKIDHTLPSPFCSEPPWGWCTVSGHILQLVLRQDWTAPVELSGILPNVLSASCAFEQNGSRITVIPGPPISEGLRVIRLKFDGPVKTEPGLYPQNGVLNLAPAHGIIFRELVLPTETTGIVPVENEVSAVCGSICRLAVDGAFICWHHPGDGIVWDISLPGTDQYVVSLITESRIHSGKWYGNREIEVEFSGQRLHTELRKDSPIVGCYSRAVSRIGTISAGTGRFLLRTIGAGRGAADMKLVGVVISSHPELNMIE